jgi:hypothetical protein
MRLLRFEALGGSTPQGHPAGRAEGGRHLQQAPEALGELGVRGQGAHLILPQVEVPLGQGLEIGRLGHEKADYSRRGAGLPGALSRCNMA